MIVFYDLSEMIIKFLSYEVAKIVLVTEISPLSAKNFFHTFVCRLEKLRFWILTWVAV
jgi:hypothetical protein